VNILAIADNLPKFDKFSGDLRFFQLLTILAKKHSVCLCCIDPIEDGEAARYVKAFEQNGITIQQANILGNLKSGLFDIVIFEFYFSTAHLLDEVRIWQPDARIVIDSVDVHYLRLLRKFDVSDKLEDEEEAARVKRDELQTYSSADVVLTVSAEDKNALLKELPALHVEIVPNIHPMPSVGSTNCKENSLLFVGNFNHDPNVDAVRYFCRDIFPLIRQEIPTARLSVIGDNTPESITELSSETTEILGYVRDLHLYLQSSCVAIAPLRYGAGLKGKIGEAMSYGLPVVTTSIGAEGFGVVPERHLLVGDTAPEFAQAVIRLLKDQRLRTQIGDEGRQFIKDHFSIEAVSKSIDQVVGRISVCKVKKISISRRARRRIKTYYDRYIGWRFDRSQPYSTHP
jgi:O-antigen biosynthesis protein